VNDKINGIHSGKGNGKDIEFEYNFLVIYKLLQLWNFVEIMGKIYSIGFA
jgi:hypothetical protein